MNSKPLTIEKEVEVSSSTSFKVDQYLQLIVSFTVNKLRFVFGINDGLIFV